MAGAITFKAEKAFRRLLELDTVRGPHSTGILQVQGSGKTNVVKGLGTPWDLYEHKKCEEIFLGSSNVLLGHNRWATKGAISKVNAHPFEFENVVGAHNGTLNSVFQLDDYQSFDVDSENIYYDMNRNGVYETIPKVNGAYALTWYDKKEKTINFIRNKERPLFFTFSKDMKTLFWASEAWMLRIALNACDIEHMDVFDLPVDSLHTFDIDMRYASQAEPFTKARVRTLKGYEPKKSVNPYLGSVSRSSNVTPITSGVAAMGKTKRPYAEYQKRLDKYCTFSVGKVETSISGQKYIQCWDVSDEDIQIRVYPMENGDLWNLMVNSTEYFQGLAKNHVTIEGGYLTIDLRTVSEVEVTTIDMPTDEEFVGFEDEVLTKEQWEDRTRKCCSWCASPAEPADHQELAWIDKYTFLCPDCAVQPELQQYLNVK